MRLLVIISPPAWPAERDAAFPEDALKLGVVLFGDSGLGCSGMTDSPVVYDFDPRNLPPDLLRAIGLMAAASAQAEAAMQHLIGSLLRLDLLESLAVTAHMSAPLKDQVARTLIELSDAPTDVVDQLDDLLDALEAATRKRNVVVHNSCARHPVTGEVFSYRESARGSLQVSLQPVRIEEIEQDATQIFDAGLAIIEFMVAHGLGPTHPEGARRAPFNRKKEAREKRREARRAAKSA